MVSRNKSPISQWYLPRSSGTKADPFGLNCSMNASKEAIVQHTVTSPVSSQKTLPQQIMPVLLVLRFLGALPLQFSTSGAARLRLVSRPMIYSVFFYCLFVTASWFAYSHWFNGGFRAKSEFSNNMFGILALILVSEVIFVPGTHWFKARHMATLLSDWVNFQHTYNQRTGKCLQFGLHRGRLIALLVVITLLQVIQQFVSELFFYDYNLKSSHYRDVVVYCLTLELRNFVVILWVILCRSTKMAARTMLRHFKQDMETSTRPTDTISDYMGLWLELSRLVAYIGTAFCNVYNHLIMYLVAAITIYTYYLIFAVMEGILTNILWLISETVINFAILFIICDCATDVYQQVGVSFRQYLLSLRVDSKQWNTHSEVDSFLRILEVEAPIISLNGYVTINRALLSTVASVLVTYLVVLVQFRLSS